jgi:hypothetical protein
MKMLVGRDKNFPDMSETLLLVALGNRKNFLLRISKNMRNLVFS